jgi:ferritin-like protein
VTEPRISALLEFFGYDHLPKPLQEISKPFAKLAHKLVDDAKGLDNTRSKFGGKPVNWYEVEAALRKLLEAKDCAVRAML